MSRTIEQILGTTPEEIAEKRADPEWQRQKAEREQEDRKEHDARPRCADCGFTDCQGHGR